jgi:hypothetical protein
LGNAAAAAGALSWRNRCASSVADRQRPGLDDRLDLVVVAVAAALQSAGVLERGDRAMPGKRSGVPASQLSAVERDRENLAVSDPDLDAAADEVGVQRVVAGIEPNVRIRRDPGHPPAVGVRCQVGQRGHDRQLLGQAINRPGPGRAVRSRVDPLKPRVELVLEVELVREHAPRFEVRLRVALQPLDRALGLRVPGPAEMPADLQLPAERRELVCRAALVGVDARLAIPNQCARQAAELPKAASDPGQQILGLLAEDQGAGAGTRVTQACNDHEPRPRLPMPDRHLRARLPNIKLADLARPVDRPLRRPGGLEQRPDLPQVVIKDRLAAIPPQRLQQLADADPGQRGILAEQPLDLGLERIELRAARPARVPRRHTRAQRRPDRVAREPGPPGQLLDRDATNEMLPPKLSPLLHTDHSFTALASITQDQARLGNTPDASANRPRGSEFNRRRGVSFHPAPTLSRTWRLG